MKRLAVIGDHSSGAKGTTTCAEHTMLQVRLFGKEENLCALEEVSIPGSRKLTVTQACLFANTSIMLDFRFK